MASEVSKNCFLRPKLGSGYLKHSPIHSLKIDPIQSLSKSTPNLLRNTGGNWCVLHGRVIPVPCRRVATYRRYPDADPRGRRHVRADGSGSSRSRPGGDGRRDLGARSIRRRSPRRRHARRPTISGTARRWTSRRRRPPPPPPKGLLELIIEIPPIANEWTYLIIFIKSYCHVFDHYAGNISVFLNFILVITNIHSDFLIFKNLFISLLLGHFAKRLQLR